MKTLAGTEWGLWAVMLLVASLIGISLALSIYEIPIFILAMMATLTLIAFPVVGVWVIIAGALIAFGLIDLYMPILRPLAWAVALLSMLIAAIALINAYFGQASAEVATKEGKRLVIWLFIFVLIVIFSSVANWHGIGGSVIGLKGYFQIWGLLIAIYYLMKSAHDSRRLISFFVLLGILQLPFALHQYLVLVPMRSSEILAAKKVVATDIVAGTFGGDMMGGGRSPNLALLCVVGLTIVLAQWRSGLRSTGSATLVMLPLLVPMFISEAKLFLVLLPIALFLLFKDNILRKPLKAVVAASGLAILIMAIFFSYSLLPGAKSQQSSSLKEMWRGTVEYNAGKEGYGGFLLNRSTVYPFWLKEHADRDMLIPALIGHGPGALSSGTVVVNISPIYRHYLGYGIELTALSSLLWEVGLVGTVTVFAVFLLAYRLGGRLADRWRGTLHWPTLKAAQIAIPLFFACLLHNSYFLFDLSFQTMLMIILGYLLTMTRFEKKHD